MIWGLLAHTTPKGQNIFGEISLAQYQTLFKWLCFALQVCDYSPHSPRAGFASEGFLKKIPFTELRETGRWTSDSSLRIYLDVIATSTEIAEQDSKSMLPLLRLVDAEFDSFFRWWPGCSDCSPSPLPATLTQVLNAAVKRWPIPMKEGAAARTLR